MLIKDIPKNHAEKLISAIAELRPEMSVSIVAEDYSLYQLGLIQYIPCLVEIEASEDEITKLADEVLQMEIDAWNFDDRELKNPEISKQQKELNDRYRKYAINFLPAGGQIPGPGGTRKVRPGHQGGAGQFRHLLLLSG